MAFLELHGLCKHYGQSVALHPATIAVEQGQFLCLLGPSGCGKTTLLNCIAGITDITDGSVLLDGRDITRLKPELRRCGMVFQSYALFPNLSVAGNIAYGLRGPQWSSHAQKQRVEEMLALVGLSGYEHRRPVQLSGGQQQRVALARALAPSPDILLLDEPLSALDAQVRVRLGEELRHLQRELGITTVMVTHDQQEALALADRIVVMNHGRIEQQGTPEEIWRAPANLFVARFVGDMNLLHLPGSDGEMCGIRYEDVRVLEATDFTLKVPRTWTARVESVQYMGRCMRLSLLLQDYATRLYADMPPAEQHYAVRDLVAVHLPEEACRYWPDATAAGEALP